MKKKLERAEGAQEEAVGAKASDAAEHARRARQAAGPRLARGKVAMSAGDVASAVLYLDINSADDLLTVAESAALLRISMAGMRRLQQRRLVPFIKVGGSVRFAKCDLIAYLRKRRVDAIG